MQVPQDGMQVPQDDGQGDLPCDHSAFASFGSTTLVENGTKVAKSSGKTEICQTGGAKSGAVVADEVLEHLVANWQHLPEHIKLAIQPLVKAGGV